MMKSIARSLIALVALAAAATASAAELKVGDKAPPFKLKGSDGKEYALNEMIGENGVVLAWFPKAGTPG